MNLNRKSDVKQGNDKRAGMKFVLSTGDMADNQQTNETQWYVQVMDGGMVDPFSGQTISDSNPCDQAESGSGRALNDDVDRRYTGVQDYGDWRGRAEQKQDDFWDPDEAPPTAGSPYAGFPRYPGLLERAQQPFTAEGLGVPWYAVRGNHDGLIGGHVRGERDSAIALVTTACIKVYPNDKSPIRSAQANAAFAKDLADPAFIHAQLANAGLVPPDPNRALVTPDEYKQLHGALTTATAWGSSSRRREKASNGAAAYYAFTRRGIRFIALDTVAEGGGADRATSTTRSTCGSRASFGGPSAMACSPSRSGTTRSSDERGRHRRGRRGSAVTRRRPAATTTRATARRSTSGRVAKKHPEPVPQVPELRSRTSTATPTRTRSPRTRGGAASGFW